MAINYSEKLEYKYELIVFVQLTQNIKLDNLIFKQNILEQNIDLLNLFLHAFLLGIVFILSSSRMRTLSTNNITPVNTQVRCTNCYIYLFLKIERNLFWFYFFPTTIFERLSLGTINCACCHAVQICPN